MQKYYFLFLSLCFLNNYIFAYNDSITYRDNPNYIQQLELYSVYKTKQKDIVMLGNSITHGAAWNELLNRTDVVSRGIPSDVIEGYISRLDNIINLKPKVVFVMGGINDIYNWIPVEKIFQNYSFMIEQLRKRNIQVVIQSTLYVSDRWQYAADRNIEVKKLNKLLQLYSLDNNITFIDLNEKMSKGEFLDNFLTYDGLHLNGKGYRIWSREVERILKELKF
jgi:lysophospholipase L1-like esterase